MLHQDSRTNSAYLAETLQWLFPEPSVGSAMTYKIQRRERSGQFEACTACGSCKMTVRRCHLSPLWKLFA